MIYIFVFTWAVLISFTITTFFLKLKEFKTNNHRYVIYLGWHKDVLICDGKVVDMFKGMSFSPVNLEFTDGEGEKVLVKVSQFFNSYTLKVNDKILDK